MWLFLSLSYEKHGAGRAISRQAAKKKFSLSDREKATGGVQCRKDADAIDETAIIFSAFPSPGGMPLNTFCAMTLAFYNTTV